MVSLMYQPRDLHAANAAGAKLARLADWTGPVATSRPALRTATSTVAGSTKLHKRTLGWKGTAALAMGGSNQSLFLITALFAGQGDILGQGSAAVPLLIIGLLLSYAAAPGWTELALMNPDRVGGIAAACTTAFRPYSSILSAITGVCYWWGWVPTCGVTALLSAAAIQAWCLPHASIPMLACGLVVLFATVNLCGIKYVTALALPIAVGSSLLAFASMIIPVASGNVDWRQATDFHLTTPFAGTFGSLTSIMAGLYLIGFGAPAFEAALCHVGETLDPVRNVRRAILASAVMAAVYFVFLPVVWLGTLGSSALGQDLTTVLGPTFAPVLGSSAKAAAIGFMMFNMFHGTIQPLAGATRTLSQLADDGLAPRFLGYRLRNEAPFASIIVMATFAIVFLLIGDPIWLIAAANFTYLIGISLPSIAVWLLRKNEPLAIRPYRAPRFTIGLGVGAAVVWALSAAFGFQQFGLPTTVLGLLMAYSGAAIYAWRMIEDRHRQGLPLIGRTLHTKMTGAMLLVLALDAVGYILAVDAIPATDKAFVVALEDIFVIVAMLTITVGIVLPGIIAHSIQSISTAAVTLTKGTLQDFADAMDALGAGNLDAAHASIDITPVQVRSRDELGALADSFNILQDTVKKAAVGLDHAREGLHASRLALLDAKDVALYDAAHDPLTGLPNRSRFIDLLETALAKGKCGSAKQWAVVFIDLDGFKFVNDSLGHIAGNTLLIETGNRFRALLGRELKERRRGSRQPTIEVLARLGGDEFTVLVSNCDRAGDAHAAASRVQDILAVPFSIQGQEIHLTASMGITTNCGDYATTDDILRDADLAMYRAKNLGKNRAIIYEPSMHALVAKRLKLESDMRKALRDQDFVLHFQPIVSMASEAIVGFEALVRWQPPGQAMVHPMEFISIAEETGLIVPLGKWVLEQACEAAQSLQRQFGPDRNLTISVNLSPKQFLHQSLVRDVQDVLLETGVDPALMILEITESCTMGAPEHAVRVLSQLKALGLRLSVDDFGTGYSSLSYLHQFPVDILKIDRTFIKGLPKDADSRQITKTILALAQGMELKAIAEGVETPEQFLELRRMGCDFVQGFLFSQPVTLHDAAALVRASRPGSKDYAALAA